MASSMGLLDRFRAALSPEPRLWNELTDIAGRNESLVARLTRHAARCPYGNLRSGVESLAETQAANLKQLRSILSEKNLWPRPPEPARDGANNWERLSLDLELLIEITQQLHRAASEWEGIDPELGDKLAALAIADDARTSELRALALKFDPQALD